MKSTEYMRLLVMTLLPVVLGLGVQAQSLQLTPGIHWVGNGSSQLILHNASLINNGSFIADSGTVVFSSDTGSTGAFIGGTNPVSFYQLTIGKSANDLQLNSDAFVTGRITLDSGNLQLNGYLLDLGSSGTIVGERNEARITGAGGGAIRVTSLLNGPHSVNPGNIGVEITSDADLGSTVITRGHFQLTNSRGETSIQRWFDIVPETNSNLHASLRFFYLDGELAGKNKNALALFSGDDMNNTWTCWGKDDADATSNWVLKSNVDQLHRFSLAIGSRNAFSKTDSTITSMQVYPTPATNEFTLQIVSEKGGNGIIYLYDQAGHLLEEKRGYWQAGGTTINWDIGKYAAGVYYLSIGNLSDGTLKVIKQ
ncbi:MAG TPA: T9SS type A sorting domain-containing protein [Puia sp.]|nr:T9SS type A sorting domain-containing protein [Puia sp.]